jgi:hypothetical protein
VDVPPLEPDYRLSARQRMLSAVSNAGPPQIVPKPPFWVYAPDSAFRFCQLTQDWDPTGRPRPIWTTPFGITGTDLGIPVEHKGRLYLFFGDCTPADDVLEDADPIAWTTVEDPDDLEAEPPDMHWLLRGDGKFRRLHVNQLPELGNFEVPGGGFSYDERLYLFIATQRDENPTRMTASFLAAADDPRDDFALLAAISKTTGPAMPPIWPGRRFMLNISATVVRNADCPGLPATTGDGLLMFGSSNYRGDPLEDRTPIENTTSNVYLAWAPLTPGTTPPLSPIPAASQWQFLVGVNAVGRPLWDVLGGTRPPLPILPPDPPLEPGQQPVPRLLGEISVVWYPDLRRWVLAGSVDARVNVARYPWGPWTVSDAICSARVAGRDARNLQPGERWNPTDVTYAPYLVGRWVKWDRSTRRMTLYYILSIWDDPHERAAYQPQLMRSEIQCKKL